MQTDIQQLIKEIEAVAASLNIQPGTVGERAGQGGHFYKRLLAGKRVWPQTIEAVRERLKGMQGESSGDSEGVICDTSHDNAPPERQAHVVRKDITGKRAGAA